MRSRVFTSEWRYATFTPFSPRYVARSSAMRLVRVVTSTRSPFFTISSARLMRSSIWPAIGRMVMTGSTRPVGRMTCSTILVEIFRSKGPGVAVV